MNDHLPHTERSGKHDNLEQLPAEELLLRMNEEDQSVALTVREVVPQIAKVVERAAEQMAGGGRLFYLGAGTSGRLGIVDASECPPTFGIEHGRVIGLIAGGDGAIRKAVEFAEDDPERGWHDLQEHGVNAQDFVVGIAASGRTPYVVGAIQRCRAENIPTACITCNENTALEDAAEMPIVAVTGPEFVTGSTRLKAGTAQKLILNMLSTGVMIKLGRVKGNKMVDMQLANAKLVERGTRMIVQALGVSAEEALQLLETHGSVRKAIDHFNKKDR
jgi:N-acetylmuramic acid 6-phosphate etherase